MSGYVAFGATTGLLFLSVAALMLGIPSTRDEAAPAFQRRLRPGLSKARG
jgi:hypothetical protein